MLNYMNGNTFIPNITSIESKYLLDSIIFMLYTCCNILSLAYIVENKYLGIQYRYLRNTDYIDEGYSEDKDLPYTSANEMDNKSDQ